MLKQHCRTYVKHDISKQDGFLGQETMSLSIAKYKAVNEN